MCESTTAGQLKSMNHDGHMWHDALNIMLLYMCILIRGPPVAGPRPYAGILREAMRIVHYVVSDDLLRSILRTPPNTWRPLAGCLHSCPRLRAPVIGITCASDSMFSLFEDACASCALISMQRSAGRCQSFKLGLSARMCHACIRISHAFISISRRRTCSR